MRRQEVFSQNRRWIRLAAAAALLGASLASRAQAQFGVNIAVPANGAVVYNGSGHLVPNTNDLRVSGSVSGVDQTNQQNFLLLVQGTNTPININPLTNTATFNTTVWIGPTGTPFGLPYVPSWYPYVQFFTDDKHIMKPIIAELYHIGLGRVVARSRVTIFDIRPDMGIVPYATGPRAEAALTFELTAAGLDALEPTHTTSMPQPSVAAFATVLSNEFSGLDLAYAPPTGLWDNGKACIPVAEADPAFQNLTAWSNILTTASVEYTLFQAARGSNDPAQQAFAADSCVRSAPQVEDFELCVGNIEGTSDTLSVRNIASTDMQIGTVDPILASTVLRGLRGTVDGRLRGLFFRYKEHKFRCNVVPRPQASIDDAQLTGSLATWASCNDLQLEVERAASNLLPFTMVVDSANPERNLMQAVSPPMPNFVLGANRREDPNRGVCGRQELSPHVTTLLQMYYSRISNALNNAWRYNSPNTQQALALDKLFSRWETGIFGDRNDHTFKMEYAGSPMALGGWPMGFGPDRLYASVSSEVQANASALLTSPPASWVFPQHVPFPEGFPCLDFLNAPCLPGRSYFGTPFDVSYSVTTGALNQVLAQLSATAALRFDLAPTYRDLGVTPPPGARPSDKAVLDGTVLGQWFSGFSQLGTTRVSLTLYPLFQPFTWMPPDPQGVPTGHSELTYQMGHFIVDFVGDNPGPMGSNLWLRVLVDFYEPEFDLSLHTNPAQNLLVPALSGNQNWVFTIVHSEFTNCRVSPMTQYPSPPLIFDPCGADMAAKVGELVRPVLEQRLLGMLSRYPAPLRYNAAGEASIRKDVIEIEKYQWGQVITFYGQFQ